MAYETFRNEMTEQLLKTQPLDTTQRVLSTMDLVAANYDFEPKCTDLIVSDDSIPQIVRIYIAAKAVEGKSKHTLKQYLYILSRFFNSVHLPYDKVTANDIRVYLYTCQQKNGVAGSTLDRIRSIIATFYWWCVNEDYLEKNPAKKIQPIKHQHPERPYMTAFELKLMRNACKTPREHALVEFLFSTGCRVSEACSMKLDDIDFNNMNVFVRHGKGDKQRTTYLTPSAVVEIRKYLATRDVPSCYLFARARGRLSGDTPVSARVLETEIANILSRTTIKKNITPHVFRHTTATIAVRGGMPVDQLQRLLGHSNIGTTMIYAKSDDADVKRSHSKYIA